MEYFYATKHTNYNDHNELETHYNLRKNEDNGTSHLSFLIKTEQKDVERIVNLMNEACRYHLPEGVAAIN